MFKFRVWNADGEYCFDCDTLKDAQTLISIGFENAALVRECRYEGNWLVDRAGNLIKQDGTIFKTKED